MSLGSYCALLNVSWSNDEGKTWKYFTPDPLRTSVEPLPAKDFREYVTPDDWSKVTILMQQWVKPSPASLILASAHQLLDSDHLRHALMEGVSALELAVSEFINAGLTSESMKKACLQFLELPLPSQVSSLAVILRRLSTEDVEATMDAIRLRNLVVHEGSDPPADTKKKLDALLRTTASLIVPTAFKFPTADSVNLLRGIDQWAEWESKNPFRSQP